VCWRITAQFSFFPLPFLLRVKGQSQEAKADVLWQTLSCNRQLQARFLAPSRRRGANPMPSCGRGNNLTEAEVERLRKAACTGNRNGQRDETMILIPKFDAV